MEIKTTMYYYYTPGIMVKLKIVAMSNYWEGIEELDHSCITEKSHSGNTVTWWLPKN